MDLPTLLSSLGLSKTESGIYIDLLQYGTQTVSSIARTSKLHRPAIYKSLPVLIERGLVTERKVGKLTQYAAEPPEKLRGLLDTLNLELDLLIPTLSSMYEDKKPIVRRLDGKAGLHEVFLDILRTLKKGEEFYRITSVKERSLREIGLPKGYEKERDEKQLERLVISNDEFIRNREPKLEESLVIVPERFLPFSHNVCQFVYGNKIAYLDYDGKISTIIENATLASFQKDVFRMLFRYIKHSKLD